MFGEDYPRNEMEFDERFSSEEACVDYLFLQRWPEGFVCPRCNSKDYWRLKNGLFECCDCRLQSSVTSGTIMHGTRKPLKMWFKAMWLFSSNKTGISAAALQRLLGLGSYQTAWSWLSKLRSSTVLQERQKLKGEVEVDEIFVGGVEEGNPGRGAISKATVAVAVEKQGRKTGRIRMQVIADSSSDSLLEFISGNVESGSVVVTDGWAAYSRVSSLGYAHQRRSISSSEETASSLLPGVHIAASLLKRRLLGTYQGNVDPKHLQKYLDEFVFRYNRRRSRWVGKKFMRIVQQSVCTAQLFYWQLVGRVAANVPLRLSEIQPDLSG